MYCCNRTGSVHALFYCIVEILPLNVIIEIFYMTKNTSQKSFSVSNV